METPTNTTPLFLPLTFPTSNNCYVAGFSCIPRGAWRYGTDSDDVLINHTALAKSLNIPITRIVVPDETHTCNVRIVVPDDGGTGVVVPSAPPNVDGIVTNHPRLALAITVADCTPLYLFDPQAHVIALLHCGWRGTCNGIVAEGVHKMCLLGAAPPRILAVIGPRICANCYEVGPDLLEEFSRTHTQEQLANIFTPKDDGKYLLDLATSLRIQLVNQGLRHEHISLSRHCTYHESLLLLVPKAAFHKQKPRVSHARIKAPRRIPQREPHGAPSRVAREGGLGAETPVVGQRRPALPRADPAVPSALGGLTSGFGMGPGVPPLPWSLTNDGRCPPGTVP